jgi:hypothetical protein
VGETAAMDWIRDELSTGAYPGLDASAVGTDPQDEWSEIAERLSDEARFERGLCAMLDGAQLAFGLP